MDSPFRVAFIDIETAPNLGYTWAKWEQNVISFAKEWFILSFAVKWAGEKQTTTYGLPDFPGYKRNPTDDARLTKKLWEVLDEADLVVAHNGDKFDLRKANARFLAHKLPPPSPYKTVDTLKLARKYFSLNSNKLDDVANTLGVGRKAETGGFQLWLDCMAGKPAAWKKMLHYNAQDVILLEKVYEKLRPWHATHPRINGYYNCRVCGSDKLQSRGRVMTSTKGSQTRFQCQSCAAWSTYPTNPAA